MAEEAPTKEQEPKPLSLLAREKFGDNFHGEVPPAEPEPEPEPDKEPDEPEEVQTEEVEPQDAAEEPDTEPDSEESSETEEVPISSLDELIEHYEWDPEWVNQINVPVKVDGKTSAVPLQELVANHQKNQAADKRLEEAKAKAQEANQRFEQQKQQTEQEYAVALQLVEHMESELDNFSSGVDWKSLRQDDPAEYSAKKAEFQERKQNIEKLKQDARQKYQEWANQSQVSDEQLREYANQEMQKLAEKIPEVTDEKKAPEWQQATAKYMKEQGFTKEEIANMYDHRLLVLAHKARLRDEDMKKVDAAKKKVVTVPKITKPGTAQNQQEQSSKRKAQKARERLKGSGNIRDALSVLQTERGG